MRERDKRFINMLANIDNYLGRHEGRLGPILIYLAVAASPFLVYAVALQRFVPLKFAIIFEIPWCIRFAFLILGKENKKLEQYRKERKGIYKTASNLVKCNVLDDGLVEYMNGRIAYMITGYTQDYVDNDSFTIDLEKFLKQLRGYSYDILSHLVIEEDRMQDRVENLQVYVDTEMVQERMQFYQEQDDYCRDNAEAYKITIVIKTSKYDWKVLREKLEKLVNSEHAYCWKSLRFCTKEECEDVLSRDLCLDVDLVEMLTEKYKSDDFYGSKVLYYGEEVPDKYKAKRELPNLQNRRVVVK